MIRSMTGFSSATGSLPPYSWAWELRAVNGKGQDIRLRVPDWIDGLEAGLRAKLAGATARGNITLSLRLSREDQAGTVRVNPSQLASVLDALSVIETAAMDAGLSLAPCRATDVAALRGVLEQSNEEEDTAPLMGALMVQADEVIADFDRMRRSEGTALEKVLQAQLSEIEALRVQAAEIISDRAEALGDTLKRNLARVMENAERADADRVAQELALIAVKTDITEEIDRLHAHVEAARSLLAEGGPVGRKLDFLMQEFNREANTLCSKAQYAELTRCGLALKAVIDQMREQVQNVE